MIKNILLFFVLLGLVVQPVYAGEEMSSGTTLTEDSYVFTAEEARRLFLRIEELETKEDQLVKYKKLTLNLEEQRRLQDFTIDLKDLQIKEYKSINLLTNDRMEKIEKREKTAKLERWGFLALGVGIMAGSIIVADKLDDYVESN